MDEKYYRRKSWKWWKPFYEDENGKTQIKKCVCISTYVAGYRDVYHQRYSVVKISESLNDSLLFFIIF